MMGRYPNHFGAPFDAIERFGDYRRAAHLISQHPSISRCESVRRLVTPAWYELEYLPGQHNIHMVRNKVLPGELLGLVVRRNITWRGECRGVFLIQIAPQASSFAEHFVIAHELGHVLVHGSLMHAGMVILEPAWDRPAEDYDRQQLVELEANICALMSVVPHQVIDALGAALGRPVDACGLQTAMQWLSAEPFDYQLARERLLLHATLEGAGSLQDFTQIVCESERSWTLNGAAALGVTQHVATSDCRGRLLQIQLHAWLELLLEAGLLSPAQWPRVRELLRQTGTRADAPGSAPLGTTALQPAVLGP